MRLIDTTNVHELLPRGMAMFARNGVRRGSRNGPVVVIPEAVTVTYRRPWERVVFWEERDANPALHLYEALWMLCGRDDIAPLLRYTKQFAEYSDDGVTQHAAYGHRWRARFGVDQLDEVVGRLKSNRDDRRCIIQMWDAGLDLGKPYRDVPCNLVITVHVGCSGKLDILVANRSNDFLWGLAGANAVHMSVLQEYLARRIGVEVGTYEQVSANLHYYPATAGRCAELGKKYEDPHWSTERDFLINPYDYARPTPIGGDDEVIERLVEAADAGECWAPIGVPWAVVVTNVLHAHHLWRTLDGEERYKVPLEFLDKTELILDSRYDWVVAMREWVERRYARWLQKQRKAR